MGVRLPAEYQEVDYLESNGQAQWIDVGFPITDSLSMELTFSAVTIENKYYMGLYQGNNGDFYLYATSDFFQIAYGSAYKNTTRELDTEKHTFRFSFDGIQAIVTENGETIWSINRYSPLRTDRNIRIAGSSYSNANRCRTYAFIAYDGANKIADFIPCYRKADSKPGMYDLVTSEFFVNKRTDDDFIVGPDVVDSISPLMVAWRRIMMATASVAKKLVKLIVTAASGLVSFTTNVIRPVKVICEFSPVQEGTGDPSPDNVRPISGWTGCEIRHFYQLFDENSGTIERKYYSNNGRIMDDDGVITTRIYTQYIPVSPNTMYTIHGDSNDLAYIRVVEFNSTQTFATRTLSSHIQNPSITIRTTSQTRYLRINPDTSVSNIFVYGTNAATTTALPITFTDPTTGDPLTVYGGTVTLNEDGSVDLVQTHRYEVYDGDENWKWSLKNNRYNANIAASGIYRPSGQSLYGIPCNYAKPGNNAVTTYFAVGATWQDSRIYFFNPTTYLDGVTDLDTFKAYIAEHPIQVVYPLATPQTYHFDNIGQLQSFLGTNNIWHNMNGDITVEYWNKQ